jgi:hypothetical protein
MADDKQAADPLERLQELADTTNATVTIEYYNGMWRVAYKVEGRDVIYRSGISIEQVLESVLWDVTEADHANG